jgi:hypothetical protein
MVKNSIIVVLILLFGLLANCQTDGDSTVLKLAVPVEGKWCFIIFDSIQRKGPSILDSNCVAYIHYTQANKKRILLDAKNNDISSCVRYLMNASWNSETGLTEYYFFYLPRKDELKIPEKIYNSSTYKEDNGLYKLKKKQEGELKELGYFK